MVFFFGVSLTLGTLRARLSSSLRSWRWSCPPRRRRATPGHPWSQRQSRPATKQRKKKGMTNHIINNLTEQFTTSKHLKYIELLINQHHPVVLHSCQRFDQAKHYRLQKKNSGRALPQPPGRYFDKSRASTSVDNFLCALDTSMDAS